MIVRQALEKAYAQLGNKLEAQVLLAYVLGQSRAWVLAESRFCLTENQEETFFDLVRRRAKGYPLQYLTGTANFMGLDFMVTPAVLIPRFDTEVLVETVLERLPPAGVQAVDVGTGSGAIAVALKVFRPRWEVWATEISAASLSVARTNAQRHGAEIRFREGDLLRHLLPAGEAAFDLVISNPPYLTAAEYQALSPDVLLEPALALKGGPDGLDLYRRLLPQADQALKPGGLLALEIGWQQGAALKTLLAGPSWSAVTVIRDYQELPRVVLAVKAAS